MPRALKFDAKAILEILPHRYPFLMVDGVSDAHEAESASGFKNVCLNDPYVIGRSPKNPRFPESLTTEFMAQVGAAGILSVPENRGKIMLFAGVDNLRFRKAVYPGDRLIAEVKKVYIKGNLGKMKAVARVNGEVVAEGEFTYALIRR